MRANKATKREIAEGGERQREITIQLELLHWAVSESSYNSVPLLPLRSESTTSFLTESSLDSGFCHLKPKAPTNI